MSTTPLPYRHHTQLPHWARPSTDGAEGSIAAEGLAYRGGYSTSYALAIEWPLANTTHREAVRTWARTEPVMDGFTSGGDILDTIDAAGGDRQDQLLLALLRLSQAGERFATRTLLQAMMPKLCQLSHYASTKNDIIGSDRSSITTDAFLTVVRTYPVARRVHGVAGNLALDTLHRITAQRRRPQLTVLHLDQWQLENAAANDALVAAGPNPTQDTALGDANPDPADEVRPLLTWAVDQKVITTEDSALLRRSFLTDTLATAPRGHSATAAEFGLSPAAVRQRCSRAIRKIRGAVAANLGSDDLLDALSAVA